MFSEDFRLGVQFLSNPTMKDPFKHEFGAFSDESPRAHLDL